MPLDPSWSEGDAVIEAALGAIFKHTINRATVAAGAAPSAASAEDSDALASELASRLQLSYNSGAISTPFTKESWLDYATQQVNQSAYDPATKDDLAKIKRVLEMTLLSKKEFAVYEADFAAIDTDKDGFLSAAEVKIMLAKQLESEPTEKEVAAFIALLDLNKDGLVSFDEYMNQVIGQHEVVGLSDEEAMHGFLADIAKVPIDVAKSGLLSGDYKDKSKEVAAMTDDQVMEEYKKQCLAVWAAMADDTAQQGAMLADVMDKMDKLGDETPRAKQLSEQLNSLKVSS